jgi:hypothetical protein
MKPCCRALAINSRTREEAAAEITYLARKFGEDPSGLPEPSDPLVAYVPHMGVYAIGPVVISYCPWCGTALPPDPTAPAHALMPPRQQDGVADGKLSIIGCTLLMHTDGTWSWKIHVPEKLQIPGLVTAGRAASRDDADEAAQRAIEAVPGGTITLGQPR